LTFLTFLTWDTSGFEIPLKIQHYSSADLAWIPAFSAARASKMSPFAQSALFRPVGLDHERGGLVSSNNFDSGAALADIDETARHQSIAYIYIYKG
jgi:hypothetical protein